MTANYCNGIWFGPGPGASRTEELLQTHSRAATEIERAEASIELCKLGKFHGKKDILDAMRIAPVKHRSGLCRIYCSVATHDEIADLVDVINEDDEEDVDVFATFSYLTLSLRAIPHLLSLAEIWEGTRLEEGLIDACRVLYPLYTDQDSRLAEVAPFYRNLMDKVDTKDYFYWGMPAFPGDLTKELIQGAAQAKLEMRELRMSMIPTLLSVWSGVECPIDFSTRIDHDQIGSTLEYVKVIASMKWLKGSKYFYGHRLD